MEPPPPDDNGVFIDLSFYALALVAILLLIVPPGGETAMNTRQEQPKIFGRFDMVVDDKGKITDLTPTDAPDPTPRSGWLLTLQLTWDAIFHRPKD